MEELLLQEKKSKKRTRRACDICNLKRSRCDGEQPCSHCAQTNKTCTYLRAQKKRGRASEKYPKYPKKRKNSKKSEASEEQDQDDEQARAAESGITPRQEDIFLPNTDRNSTDDNNNNHSNNRPAKFIGQVTNGNHHQSYSHLQPPQLSQLSSPLQIQTRQEILPLSNQPLHSDIFSIDGYNNKPSYLDTDVNNSNTENSVEVNSVASTPESFGLYGKNMSTGNNTKHVAKQPLTTSSIHSGHLPTEYAVNLNNYLFLMDSNIFNSPTYLKTRYNYSLLDDMNSNSMLNTYYDGIRFVVLLKVLPYLKQVGLPGNVASDMLEYYFDSYIMPSCKVSTIVRKRTMLMLVNPEMGVEEQQKHIRQTNEALILSMLTVASFDINHFFMTGNKRKVIFGQLIQMVKNLIKIDLENEDYIVDGGFDDVITCSHLVCLSPLLGNPAMSHLWLKRAVHLAKVLEINKENLSAKVTEEYREERRRCWWTLYILDKHLNIALSTPTVISDHESKDLFHPCDDQTFSDMTLDELPSPYENDINRSKGIVFNLIGPGVFGWMLPVSMIIGSLMYYKTYTLEQRKTSTVNSIGNKNFEKNNANGNDDINSSNNDSPRDDYWSENYKVQVKQHLAMFESNIPLLLQYSKVDSSYALVVSCVLKSMLSKDVLNWDPNGLLQEDIDFEKDLDWCIKYSEAFHVLVNYDPDMRRYPFIIRLHIFFACIDVINLLGNIDKEFVKYKHVSAPSSSASNDSDMTKDPEKAHQRIVNRNTADALTKLCHKIKRMVYIIVRCIESCMTTLPVDYLRVIRNCLMDALRDMDCLLLINGFQQQFEINRDKRKKNPFGLFFCGQWYWYWIVKTAMFFAFIFVCLEL